MMNDQNEKNYLIHYGNKNSGRYPRGSGANPYQHEAFKIASRKPTLLEKISGEPANVQRKKYEKFAKNDYVKSNIDINTLYNIDDQYNSIENKMRYTNNSKKIKQLRENCQSLYKQYDQTIKQSVDRIVGSYGDMKIRDLTNKHPYMTYKQFARKAVENAVAEDNIGITYDAYLYNNREKIYKDAKDNDQWNSYFLESMDAYDDGEYFEDKNLKKALNNYSEFLNCPTLFRVKR